MKCLCGKEIANPNPEHADFVIDGRATCEDCAERHDQRQLSLNLFIEDKRQLLLNLFEDRYANH